MTLAALETLLAPIKRRIYLLIGRAILTAIDNTTKSQTIQGKFLKDETISDVERLQEYGLETYPDTATAEGLVVFIDGNRDLGLCIVAHDRTNRPTDLQKGEVKLYDKQGNFIHMKLTSGIEINADGGATATEKMFLGETTKTELDKDKDALTELQTAINGWSPVPNDGGAALKAALAGFLGKAMADYSSCLSDKVKNN